LIGGHHPGRAIDREQHDRRGLHRNFRLGSDAIRKIRVGNFPDSAGVDDFEWCLAQPAFCDDPIARDAGLIVDDGDALAGQPIKERRFSNVRPPNYRDNASGGVFFGLWISAHAAQGAPACALIHPFSVD
jgi:hypothetical protein